MAVYVPPRKDGLTKYLPVAILIDKSESTDDIRPILNKAAQDLIRSMKDEVTFKGIVKLLVVQYSHNIQTVVDFKPLEEVSETDLDIRQSVGHTDTGRALLHTLDLLDKKKMEWKQIPQEYFQPLVFLLTDGYPDAGVGAPPKVRKDIEDAYHMAALQIHERERDEPGHSPKITFIAAGIGEDANLDRLKELTTHPDRVLKVSKDLRNVHNIEKFYELIHESTNAMFQGTPVDDVLGELWNL